MGRALRKVVRVKPGGAIEIPVSDIPAGTVAEVIVLTEDVEADVDRAQQLAALLKETQNLPSARTVSEDEIAAQIVAYRSGRA